MKRLLLLGFFPLAVTAAAQTMDHSSMPGMAMPENSSKPMSKAAKKTDPAARKGKPAATKPSAKSGGTMQMDHSKMPGMNMSPAKSHDHSAMPGMNMPAAKPHDHSTMPGMGMPSAKPATQDHSAMPGMNMNAPGHDMANMSQAEIPHTSPPPPPGDHAADRFFSPAAMADARAQLQREHGGGVVSKVMMNLGEYQIRNGADGYRWDGQAWFGGDIHRFVLKSEGEGTQGEGVEAAELQALYSRAVGVFTDVQFGFRQDFEPHHRTYATMGFQSLLPYWFDVEGSLYLSNKGELLARLEGTYDLQLTNYWILQPRAELNFAAQDTAEAHRGAGLSNAEFGLRLRYEITREFAPYIGLSWDRQVGQSANYARALGREVEAKSIVIGIRTFF